MSAPVVRRQCVYSFRMFVSKWCALTTICVYVNVCPQVEGKFGSVSCVRKRIYYCYAGRNLCLLAQCTVVSAIVVSEEEV